MKYILLALLIVLAVWVFYRPTEGFADLSLEAPSGFAALTNFFHYQLAPPKDDSSRNAVKLVPIRPGDITVLAPSSAELGKKIDAAVTTTDVYDSLNVEKDDSLWKFFYEDRRGGLSANDIACRSRSHPKQLTSTADENGGRCGWWYVEDSTSPSTAAYGTESGPEDSDEDSGLSATHPGGQWIWDLTAAKKKEDIKRCTRIRTCQFLSGDTEAELGVRCGFCPDKGYGIPVTADGIPTPTYPTDPAASCGNMTSIVTDAESCTPYLYSPFLQDIDYDYDINGTVIPGRNTDAVSVMEGGQIIVSPPCLQNPTGLKCRISLAESAGFSPSGRLLKLLQGDALTDYDRELLRILDSRGAVDLPESLFVSGDSGISMEETATLFGKLSTMAVSGPNTAAKNAAQYMVNGAAFNLCDYEENGTGPFSVLCLQQEFRKANCTAAGSEYPSTTFPYSGKTWKEIKTQFRDLHDKMSSADDFEQKATVEKCLGIKINKCK